jgi:hypothetical protein
VAGATGLLAGRRTAISLCYIRFVLRHTQACVPMPQTLQLILVLLGAAVFVVAVCRLIHLPPILGYLLVGIAVGPHALRWVAADEETR